ncbi:pro-sigmaK processing inhibitor BofA family protein [Gorillibacterium massiliense]|uniref:pro-sigmaK processing inhibitor BofA family protein n=1 Tax=Gorillibacterium massiliense TaxID=1280390 RepID=UPI0004B004A8|nr:pro-sigmaK processing inhibitor BofA family protein [Gorillibacterium massiliense]
MRTGIWIVFAGSLLILLAILIKNRQSIHGLAKVGLHIVVAALLLYGVNRFGVAHHFHLPINGGTVAVVGFLGVPGLALLVCAKMWIV